MLTGWNGQRCSEWTQESDKHGPRKVNRGSYNHAPGKKMLRRVDIGFSRIKIVSIKLAADDLQN